MKLKRPMILILITLLGLAVIAVSMAILSPPESAFYHLERNQLREITRKAEAGDGSACWCLALYYMKERDKFSYWRDMGANYGNPEAERWKAASLIDKPDSDVKEALRLMKKSAEQGNTFAQNDLGRLYYEGKTVKKDIKQAEYWFRAAALKGNNFAMEKLANILMEGHASVGKLKEAYKWWQATLIRTERSKIRPYAKEYFEELRERKKVVISKLSKFIPKPSAILKDLDSEAEKEAARNPDWDPSPKTNECVKLANKQGE